VDLPPGKQAAAQQQRGAEAAGGGRLPTLQLLVLPTRGRVQHLICLSSDTQFVRTPSLMSTTLDALPAIFTALHC
jgi:hypothetical protein